MFLYVYYLYLCLILNYRTIFIIHYFHNLCLFGLIKYSFIKQLLRIKLNDFILGLLLLIVAIAERYHETIFNAFQNWPLIHYVIALFKPSLLRVKMIVLISVNSLMYWPISDPSARTSQTNSIAVKRNWNVITYIHKFVYHL